MIKAIVCVDEEWGIGKKNGLLFNIKEDMAYFREQTKNAIVLMGYNTLLSFPESKPLKGRMNIVLCPEGAHPEGCLCIYSFAEMLALAKKLSEYEDIWVIGGAMFYSSMLPFCDEIHITKVKAKGGAEVFYPNLDMASDNYETTFNGGGISTSGFEYEFWTYRPKA